MYLFSLEIQMKLNNFLIQGLSIWALQLFISDLLILNTIRPDFLVILVLYWAISNGRFLGTISGFLIGLLIDLSGTAMFFGLSPLIYSVTGYLGGYLRGALKKLNLFYFSFSWVAILLLQFFIFSVVQYQDIMMLNNKIFFSKWIGTSIYTLCFAGILQLILPLHRMD